MRFDLAAFDALCVRAIQRLDDQRDASAWKHEPTLLGWDHVHPELVGCVPAIEV